MTLADSYSYCRHIARSRAKNFYYSFRLLSRDRHDAICAIYAFMRECDDLSDEAGASIEKLEAWRRDMRVALSGRLPDHAIWPAFADAARRFAIPHHVFEDMIDGVASDLAPQSMETFDDLYRYCYRVASVVGLAVIHIFGFDDDRAPMLAEKCGIAFQLTNIIRDVAEDAKLGRCYLPAADMRRFGVTALTDSPGMRTLLRFEGERARAFYAEGAPLVAMIHPESRASLRALIDIYSALLAKIARRDYGVFRERVRISTAVKTWLMLRAFVRS